MEQVKIITGDDRLRVENTVNRFIKEVGDNNIYHNGNEKD